MAERGTFTVILDRNGTDRAVDTQLLHEVEDALRLPRGHLERTDAMDAREFRLAEGIDGDTADRLADVAKGLGYLPRVQPKLGIRFSAQRNPLPLVAGTFGLMFALVFVLRWAGPLLGRLGGGAMGLLFVAGMVALFFAWQRSTRMPLALPTRALIDAPTLPADGVAEAGDAALAALDKLRAAIASDVPDAVRGSLQGSHDELRERVDALRREAAHLPDEQDAAASALARRLASMDADDPGRAVLQAAFDQERASLRAASTRKSEVIAELLAVRRAAADAARSLAAAPETGADEALERVRAQAAAMRRAAAEVRR